jgi:hypothetical protein
MPPQPTLADYDARAQRWVDSVVCQRRYRTTGRVVGEAWEEEPPRLRPLPGRILAELQAPPLTGLSGGASADPVQRRLGDRVEVRNLAEYEAVQR